MDIGNGIFECGQTYVALSRVKSLDGLYLTSFDPTKIKINPKVKEFYDKIPEVEYESVEETETETKTETPPHETTNIKKITLKDELQFEQYAYTDDVTVKKLSI